MEEIYLDSATARKPSSWAVSEMNVFYTELWGNIAAPHKKGAELFAPIGDASKAIAELLGAQHGMHFHFTHSAAHACALVQWHAFSQYANGQGRNHFICGAADDAPTIVGLSRLTPLGCAFSMLPFDERGIYDQKALIEAITPRTALCSLSLVSGLTGVRQPIEEFVPILKERSIALHVDISYALGQIPCDLVALEADFVTFSGEQIHAPRASGGLLTGRGIELDPFFEEPLDTASLVALGMAAKEAFEQLDFAATETARLRARFERGLLAAIPDARILFADAERAPHISCIVFPRIHAEALAFRCNERGLYFCIGGGQQQLLSRLFHDEGRFGAMSAVFSRDHTERDVDRAVAILSQEVAVLQNQFLK